MNGMWWLQLVLSSLFFLGIWARLLFTYARHRHRRLLWDDDHLKAVEIECGLREPDPPYVPPPGTLGAPDPHESLPPTGAFQPAGPFSARDMTEAEERAWDMQIAAQLDLDRRQRESKSAAESAAIAREQHRQYEIGRRLAEHWLKGDLSRGSME